MGRALSAKPRAQRYTRAATAGLHSTARQRAQAAQRSMHAPGHLLGRARHAVLEAAWQAGLAVRRSVVWPLTRALANRRQASARMPTRLQRRHRRHRHRQRSSSLPDSSCHGLEVLVVNGAGSVAVVGWAICNTILHRPVLITGWPSGWRSGAGADLRLVTTVTHP